MIDDSRVEDYLHRACIFLCINVVKIIVLVSVVRKECGVRSRVCFPRLFLDRPRAIVPRVMAAHEKVKQQNYRFTRENESKNIVQNQYFMFWRIYMKLCKISKYFAPCLLRYAR